MYFIDRDKIEQLLKGIEQNLHIFSEQVGWQTPVEQLALERLTHILIESIIDVGNQMIDGFIMRDPGSYEDVVDILIDEKVIPKESEASYKALIKMRKPLVQEYAEINHVELVRLLKEHVSVISAFQNNVRNYLVNELGPVSAFKPTKEK